MTHSAALLALDALSTYRLTRLIVADKLAAPLRGRLAGRRLSQDRNIGGERIPVVARPRVAQFIACPWCVSPYLAAAALACQTLAPKPWFYVSALLAFSALTGVISEHT